MQLRASRYLKTFFSKTTKSLLLAIFVFSVVGITTTVSAQAQFTNEQLQIQNKYSPYFNLFSQDATVLSTPAAGNLIKDVTNNNVTGVKVNIKFSFSPSGTASNEDLWGYIQDDGAVINPVSEDTFIIRLCNTVNKSQCFVQQIPYDDNADDSGTNLAHISRKNLNNDFATTNELMDFSVLGNSGSSLLNNARHVYTRITENGKNEGTISAYNGKLKLNSSTMEATLWYCAANNTLGDTTFTGETAYTGDGMNDTLATFGTLCDGNSYFRIGAPLFITIPAATDSSAVATSTNTQTSSSTTTDDKETNLPICGIVWPNEGTVVGCLAQLAYYGIYTPIAWIAGSFGSLFDFFIGYSVSDESYRYAFAVTGWKLVRDIANIMFIIIMIYTGFAAVFDFGGKGGSTLKRVVPFLIINALIINFSLFATRTVIDISNITARVFYSRMIVCDGECKYEGTSNIPKNVKRGLGGHWPLSEKIVSAFDPQKMFKTSVLEQKENSKTNQTDRLNATGVARAIEQSKGFGTSSAEYAAYYALVSLLAAIIMLFIGIMFFKVMFMFLGRVVGLYMAMIFSPFAFLTLNGGGGFFNIKGYDWGTWSKDLFNYAALAPIFVFFLYIIYSFINTDMVAQIGLKDEGGFFSTLLTIAVPMLIIYALVDRGAKMAAKYAGEFGMMAQNTLSKAVGLAGGAALGLASGGLAMAGTGIVARGAKALGNTEWGKRQALNADTNRTARFFNNTLSKTQTGSWDFRNTKLNSLVNKGVTQVTGGVKLDDRVTERLGMSTKDFAGGAVALRKKREDEIKKSFDSKIQYAHLSDDDAKELWKKKHAQDIEKGVEKESDRLVHKNLSENDSTYKAQETENARLTAIKERTERAIADIEERLKSPGISDAAKTASNNSLTTLRNSLNSTVESMKQVEDKKKAMVEDTKSNTGRFDSIKNTEEYKKGVEKKRTDLEKEISDKYGKIEKVKDYANAMRQNYVEDKQNNSLWMKDGKQRAGLSAIPLGGAGAAALAGLSTSAAVVAGAVISDAIKSRQEAFEAAAKSYRKDYGKKKGKGSKLEQNVKDLDATKANIEEIIGGKLDDIPLDQQKNKVQEEILKRQGEFDMANVEYERVSKNWKQGDPEGPLKAASRRRREAQDNLKHAENIWKKKEDLEKNIATEEEKEEKKNEKKSSEDTK